MSASANTGTNKAAIANNSSSMLTDYSGSGATGNLNVTTVTIEDALYDDTTEPDVDIYQVTATVTVTAVTANTLFIRVGAND